jgi:hypothetical protein
MADSAQHRGAVPGGSLGEQIPWGPQSESTRHVLPVTQTLADVSMAEARHAQGTPAGQSESMVHSSYEQPSVPPQGSGEIARRQRPLTPDVQSESCVHDPASEHASADDAARAWGHAVPASRCGGSDGTAASAAASSAPPSIGVEPDGPCASSAASLAPPSPTTPPSAGRTPSPPHADIVPTIPVSAANANATEESLIPLATVRGVSPAVNASPCP